jgi:lipoate-protein ligase A
MNHGILVGAGFLLGTLGVKALKSEPAHKAAVYTIAQGLKAKESAETLVDEAKAEFDDIMAEAGYNKKEEEAKAEKKAEELPTAQDAEGK